MFEPKKCLLQTGPVIFRRQIDALYRGIGSYQFSLRELLIAVTVTAGACGIVRHLAIPKAVTRPDGVPQTLSATADKMRLLFSGRAQ